MSRTSLRIALDAAVMALAIGEKTIEGVRRLATPTAPLLLRSGHTPTANFVRRRLWRVGEAGHVNGLAMSFIETLSKPNAKEREKPVSRRYAEELNRLVELAKEVAPEHDARLWPMPIRIEETMGVTQVFASYADVETDARQIAWLVPRPPVFVGVMQDRTGCLIGKPAPGLLRAKLPHSYPIRSARVSSGAQHAREPARAWCRRVRHGHTIEGRARLVPAEPCQENRAAT